MSIYRQFISHSATIEVQKYKNWHFLLFSLPSHKSLSKAIFFKENLSLLPLVKTYLKQHKKAFKISSVHFCICHYSLHCWFRQYFEYITSAKVVLQRIKGLCWFVLWWILNQCRFGFNVQTAQVSWLKLQRKQGLTIKFQLLHNTVAEDFWETWF